MDLLTVKELAAKLKITVQTVYSLIKAGQLPAGVKIGKSRRWNWEQVNEFINKKSEVKESRE